jgi:hypothetical protein
MDIYKDFFNFNNISFMYIPLLDNDLDKHLGPNIAPPFNSNLKEDKSTPFTFTTPLILQMLPIASLKPPFKRGNIIRARMLALSLFNAIIIFDFVIITLKTSISKSSVYKLKSKAISRG